MKPYHKACGSDNLGKKPIVFHRGRYAVKADIDICRQCKREVESDEIVRIDRRLFSMHMDT